MISKFAIPILSFVLQIFFQTYRQSFYSFIPRGCVWIGFVRKEQDFRSDVLVKIKLEDERGV